jgi:serine/threonine protein kinase
VERANLLDQTAAHRSESTKQVNQEPIPGYRLIERLGKGGFGEVWKCEAPGGLFKAIKFVHGNLNSLEADRAPAEEEFKAVQRIKGIRHPFILSLERVEHVNGELLIVMELADKSLHDVMAEYRAAKKPGIPRDELLAYLREAAEALDLMNVQYGLQHLDVKPRNLFLVSNHVKVADFGLVNSAAGKNGCSATFQGMSTPLYASPELFHGTISPQSDQYSLAVVYQELLTGVLPFKGKNARQLLWQHVKGRPNLAPLPREDREVVARALSKDSQTRYVSCSEFIRALQEYSSALSTPTTPTDVSALQNTPPPTPSRNTSSRVPAHSEDLPGYRFLECLCCTPLAETWKVQSPEGTPRLAKFLYGFTRRDADAEAEAITRLSALNHPVLLASEVARRAPGRLVLVSDAVEKTLWHRFQEYRAQGEPGVPRGELLSYLRTAAESLDYLYRQFALQHLGLNPRTLLLDNERLQIADFGIAQLLWLPAGQSLVRLNARYAAPELRGQQVSPNCDQYSLALIYQELLGGAATGQKANGTEPAVLPAGDRALLARALEANPSQRWGSCTEFVRALEEAGPTRDTVPRRSALPEAFEHTPRPSSVLALTPGSVTEVVTELVALAKNGQQLAKSAAPSLSADEYPVHCFTAPLPIGTARLKLEEFRQQCQARAVREDEHNLVFRIVRPRNFWQQCTGRQPGLEVHVQLDRPSPVAPAPIDVRVQIRPYDCSRKHGEQLLREMASLLLESVRSCLQVNSERRQTAERLIWHQRLFVRPIYPDGKIGEPIECKGKDISLSGIGFYLPRPLPTTQIFLDLPASSGVAPATIPASIVRVQRCGDDWYDVGALFLQ